MTGIHDRTERKREREGEKGRERERPRDLGGETWGYFEAYKQIVAPTEHANFLPNVIFTLYKFSF